MLFKVSLSIRLKYQAIQKSTSLLRAVVLNYLVSPARHTDEVLVQYGQDNLLTLNKLHQENKNNSKRSPTRKANTVFYSQNLKTNVKFSKRNRNLQTSRVNSPQSHIERSSNTRILGRQKFDHYKKKE